jgi:hypothetical protein
MVQMMKDCRQRGGHLSFDWQSNVSKTWYHVEMQQVRENGFALIMNDISSAMELLEQQKGQQVMQKKKLQANCSLTGLQEMLEQLVHQRTQELEVISACAHTHANTHTFIDTFIRRSDWCGDIPEV